MVDDKQRPGETESETPERASETGGEESASPATVDEAAGLEAAPDLGEAATPDEPPVAEAGPGPAAEEPEGGSAAAEPDAEPDAEPPAALPPPPPPPPARRRTPWGAMLLSGIIGGAVVAGAAAYGYLYYLPNDNSAINVLFARLGAVELAVRDLSAHQAASPGAPAASDATKESVTELSDRLTKLEAEVAAAAKAGEVNGSKPADGGAPAGATEESVTALADRVAKLEADVAAAKSGAAPADGSKPAGMVTAPAEQVAAMKALSDDVAGLNKRMTETAAALQQAQDSAAAAMKAAEAKPSEPPVAKAEFDGLSERVAGLQRSMATLQQDIQRQTTAASQADHDVRLAVASAGLRGAVERGAPYASELEAVKALKADPQAVALLAPFAATGVPSAATLGQELAALESSLVKRTTASDADQSYWQRLQSEAEKLVHVRPMNSAPGSSPAAAVARVEVLAKQGDIAGALAELQKLPEAVRAPAEPWIKKAQAREAAIAAARRIEAAAVAALANHP